MRRWPLALLVLFSAPALAQDTAPATPPAPEAPAPTPAAAPPPAALQAPAEKPAGEPAPAPAAQPPPPRKVPAAAATPTATAVTPPAPAPAPHPAAAVTPPAPAPAPHPAAAVTPPAPAPATTRAPALPPTPSSAGAQLAPGREGARPTEEDLSPEGMARAIIHQEARFLFQSLLTGDVRNASAELAYPFQLEDKRFNTPEELVQVWVKQLRARRTDLITLYDIEVLPIAEMEKKYGKPPARLGLDPRALKDTWAAVGNLSGHAAIFLFRGSQDLTWRAFAYTD